MVESLKSIASGLKKPAFVFAKVRGMTNFDRDEAAAILTVLPRLMNQMIVQILLDGELDGTLVYERLGFGGSDRARIG